MTYTKDHTTGLAVQQALIAAKVETPFTHKAPDKNKLERLMSDFLSEFGLDLTDDSLCETPKRIAKLYADEYFYGLDYANFPKATVVENKMKVDEMVVERKIIVNSLCEHHSLPIVGSAYIAYLPTDKVIGLSKMNRIVDFFSRRPQIQERLALQIYHALSHLLGTENVAVVIQAEHMCVKTRGVMDPCSDTITSKLGGTFKQPEVRAEFLTLCRGLSKE
jgi:GTP cyclohydrolase IA